MLVNGVAICSLPTDLPYRSVKIAELGLSILKRGGEIILWAQWTGIGKFDPSFLSSIKGARYFISFQKASLRLWKDLQADSWESRLTISVTKFLKASLLLGAYLIDNKKVSFYVGIISKGLVIIHLSYNLNKCRYRIILNPDSWDLTPTKMCKIIFLISAAGLGFYLLEQNVDFDSLS